MNLKKTGTSTPGLQRHKSMIDTDVSEQSLGVAVDILFRELNRAQQMVADFEGVDHFTWVWQKNKEMKEDGEKMDFPDELLFDEDKEEEQYKKILEAKKKAKEEEEEAIQKAKDEEEAKTNGEAEETKEESVEQNEEQSEVAE